MKRLLVIGAVLFMLMPLNVLAQDFCEGNFDCDQDVDGTDAALFKTDFGRSGFKNPCPQCTTSTQELEARIVQLETQLANVTALLAGVTRNGNDITFSGVNVHIVDGSGDTDGFPNGLGNLIVGYNELRTTSENVRIGSHNIVVGRELNYSNYGGLVVGSYNGIYSQYASVSGGARNAVYGNYGSVSGGFNNIASGLHASVSGGQNNQAVGDFSFVGGGGSDNSAWGNTAFAHYSAILGGADNTAGDPNHADRTIGQWSTVNGGRDNIASGAYSNVSGGRARSAAGGDDWVAGGLWQDE